MSGRPAPPGRKGSVKINAFKADEDVAPVAVATLTAAERQKYERDEEMKKIMGLRKQAQAQDADIPDIKKETADPKKIASPLKPVAADAAEKDRKRLEEIRARNAKLEGDDGASALEAQKAAAAKKAAEDAERAAAAKKAAEEAERAAAAKKAAEEAERAAAAKKAAEDAERAAAVKKAAEDAERAAAAKKAAEDAERAAAAEKAAEDAERAAAAEKAAEDAERAAAAKKAAEDAEKAAAAKKAAEEAEKAAAAKKAAEDAEDAEKAAAAKKAAEESEKAAAAKKAAEESERAAAVEEERLAQEKVRLAAVAAKEEALRAEKAEKAEKLRLAQLEQQKREEEEAIAEELALQQEQEQQRLQIEELRKKREEAEAKRQLEQQESLRQQAELEEQQRRMDEKLARQKEALAEAAANEEREQRERELQQQRQQAEAQERERARQEELAARQAAEQAEIARLREEEASRQQELLEAQRREEEEHNAEVLRLEEERLAAAEEARKAEEAISQYENAALEEKKRRAEAQRKKREAFLSEMDSFSTTFEAKTQVEDEAIKAEQDKHYELLAQQMKQVEETKAATLAKEAQEKEQREAQRIAAAELAAAELARANVPPPVPTVLPVQPAAPAEDTYSINLNATAEEPKKDLLADLTSSLFKPAVVPVPFPTPETTAVAPPAVPVSTPKEDVARPDSVSPAMEPIEEEAEGEEEAEPTAAAFGTEELRVPTRIGNGKAKVKPIAAKPVAVSIINARTAAATVKYSEDEEEEGTGEAGSISNVLTLEERRKLTLAQKDTWRAKQADLTEKRKEFHGVVTYTFDGVFAWQMYGSAEAVDESGAAYTEYLMRCQWGTTFENMQPWIVAHRYKEFDKLDQQLKAKFPRLEPNMPKLPKKELFRSLQADVVAERRGVLEEYMSKIVNSMPSLLRSELMNDFLDITNRISGIRLMLLKASNALVEARHTPPPTPTPSRPVSVTPQQKASGSGVSSNSKYGIEDPLAFRAQTVDPLECFPGDVEEETLLWTVDEAEAARAAKNSRSLDEDQLGHLETDIKLLGQLLRKTEGKALVAKDSKFRAKFKTVSKAWPSLRATAVVGMGVDFTLIPRAMQAEEDLVRILNEFRNIDSLVNTSNSSSMRSALV